MCGNYNCVAHQLCRRIMAGGQSSVTQIVVGPHGPRCSGGTCASSMVATAEVSPAERFTLPAQASQRRIPASHCAAQPALLPYRAGIRGPWS